MKEKERMGLLETDPCLGLGGKVGQEEEDSEISVEVF